MITIPGSTYQLPGRAIETRLSSHLDAWDGLYLTIQLDEPVEGLRVHSTRRGLTGDWFAIGDVVVTRREYIESRALPKPFVFIARCTLRPGTIVNVGRCSAVFGRRGGGDQAEFLQGPLPAIVPLDALWSDHAGHA